MPTRVRPTVLAAALILGGCLPTGRSLAADPEAGAADPFAWLEDIDSPRSLAWVGAHNQATAQKLAGSAYDALYHDALGVLDARSRIPEVTQKGDYLYNLWKDRDHPRGVFRRTRVADFSKETVPWETVLDIDALAKAEGKPWAFGGAEWLEPENQRCLILLSPGGGDAAEIREFDVGTGTFVPGGFRVPSAKQRATWVDADTLLIGSDFGKDSLTTSGYPRILRRWRRGTPLADAPVVYEGKATSVSVGAEHIRSRGGDIDLISEGLTFWTNRYLQLVGGALRPLAIPESALVVDAYQGRLVLRLREDWKPQGVRFPAGSVLAADPSFLRGEPGSVDLILAPSAHEVVESVAVTEAGILVASLDNVRGRLCRLRLGPSGWTRDAVHFPDNGALKIVSAEATQGDAFVAYESFTVPPTLYHVDPAGVEPQVVKSQAPAFDGDRFETAQYWATSADGTRVPYFVVSPKGRAHDGTAPVWMFSYGGFEVALTPSYSGSYEDLHGAYGKLWLERGGTFVLANIRGGGEFGPAWHQAALREHHVRAFEDFEAVVRDLFERDITSPAHLGIEGRSNGGLLVSSLLLRHPEYYGAVVCGNPLIDMKRYSHLLAGASWMAEYGDPDVPADWAFIREYSPYQRLQGGLSLPPVFFYTSTRDDRVHPGHARKMAAKMESLGYAVDYFENTEGGHHGSVTSEQLATRLARTYAFLWSHLK